MSYEGYTEIICEGGHYYTKDAHEGSGGYNSSAEAKAAWMCPNCGLARKWTHEVDQTNGYDEEFQYVTGRANIKPTHFFDVPAIDHRGNQYVVKDQRYEPAEPLDVWTKVEPLTEDSFKQWDELAVTKDTNEHA